MAKKKKETGPSPAMIIVLVFFILSTAVLGVMTYLGVETEETAIKNAEEAKKALKPAQENATKEELRKVVLRIAMGVEDPEDREKLATATKEYHADILEEHERINKRLTGSFPTARAFDWPLMDELRAGGTSGEGQKPAPAPRLTVPSIAKEWAKRYQDERKKFLDAEIATKNAETQKKAADDRADAAKKTFDTSLAALDDSYKKALAKLTTDFNNLKVEATKAGTAFEARAAELAKEKAEVEESLQKQAANVKDLADKLKRAQNPDPTDFEARFKSLDLTKLDERKGEIVDKNDTFVTLRFANRNQLAVGQTFMVLAPNKSLVSVIEREKALEKDYREHRGLFGREPFSGNELLKGTIEITEVTGEYSARARIVSQAEPIRDPISKKDTIYNTTLTGNSSEHVAFCGIIDLDGDGLPNNEEFIRILERNKVIVDAYLDLKTGEIKGRGLQPSTKFLILGADAPEVGRVREMLAKAKENGIQVIDARKFLMLIGVKLPANPLPPRYSTTNLTGDGAAAPKEAAPKEDAPPKKDAPPVVPELKKEN